VWIGDVNDKDLHWARMFSTRFLESHQVLFLVVKQPVFWNHNQATDAQSPTNSRRQNSLTQEHRRQNSFTLEHLREHWLCSLQLGRPMTRKEVRTPLRCMCPGRRSELLSNCISQEGTLAVFLHRTLVEFVQEPQ
jgi:hypothetical protein